MSNEARSVFASRFAQEEAAASAAPASAPPRSSASAPPPPAAAEVSAAAGEAEEDGRSRFTFYMDSEVAEEVVGKATDLFFDSRGRVSKGDVYTEVVRRGLAQWDDIQRTLWADTR